MKGIDQFGILNQDETAFWKNTAYELTLQAEKGLILYRDLCSHVLMVLEAYEKDPKPEMLLSLKKMVDESRERTQTTLNRIQANASKVTE